MVDLAVELAAELIEFPRHLSQHVGGYVLTQDRLDTYVPIGNAAMDDRTFIEWDKDDVDALSMMKVDVLALGMLTCIRKCFDLIALHKGERWELATVRRTTEGLRHAVRGESLGVFQVESRAQMNMLPRLKPRLSTTSSSRSRSCGPARSRATWCIPICGGGNAARR
jgi:error-prone DNA polymerase